MTKVLARVEHMTCAWFTSCMSLGGISNLLLSRIIDSAPLHRIGIALLILNMLYFIALILLQVVRFTCTPARVGYTLSHPIECLFVPTIVLAAATVLNGLAAVAGRDVGGGLRTAFQVAFWVYFAAALVVGVGCYTVLWARAEGSMHHMNPAWVLPVFPLMLCGSVAVAVVPTQTEESALNIAISFTIICLLGLAQEMQRILPALPLPSLPASTYETLFIGALAASILLWTVAAWFYLITLAAIAAALLTERRNVQFILAWWAAVFPITGFATATNAIADALDSSPIKILAQIMVVVLAVVFVAIAAAHIHAVANGIIMAQGKDEDRLIDTMHRQDEEKVPAAERERETPPTYPNTPAVSVFRLERKLTA
ncbi:c4-dicarboxylate transporter [Moesziomyces antarcticus]|uniref:C4-dicarboxylate transporter n=1 Tax=Pseudozyma antarctica TaxID=84753 RepID=A0A081CJV1_PSEA2|nr:c4-dicarboxylate transporter [Moesziomyces antarcticus]GAK66947.1 c4-dicarboxylate transporter [Moesziomyces antarcticus]